MYNRYQIANLSEKLIFVGCSIPAYKYLFRQSICRKAVYQYYMKGGTKNVRKVTDQWS